MPNLGIFARCAVIMFVISASANHAFSEGVPDLTIQSKLQTFTLTSNQKGSFGSQRPTFGAKGNVTFSIDGEMREKAYGFVTAFELDRTKERERFIPKAYFYFADPDFGTVHLGDSEGTQILMFENAVNIIGAYKGFNGNGLLYKAVKLPKGVVRGIGFLNTVLSYSQVTWMSPSVSEGFRIGMSYAPNTNSVGNINANNFISSGSYTKNQRAFTVAYNDVLSDGNYHVYAGYVSGRTNLNKNPYTKSHRLENYQLGFVLNYSKFRLGGSYFDNKRSYIPVGENSNAGKGINAALSYKFDFASVAFGFSHVWRRIMGEKSQTNIATVSLTKKLVPGMVLYGEIDFFNFITTPGVVSRGGASAAQMGRNNAGQFYAFGLMVRT